MGRYPNPVKVFKGKIEPRNALAKSKLEYTLVCTLSSGVVHPLKVAFA